MPDEYGPLALAVCGGLTALGVVIAFVTFRRNGAASGLRMLGWSMFPLAAYLTGIVSVLWTLVREVVSWAGGIVFNGLVQAGAALFGLGIILIVVAAFLRRRSGGKAEPTKARSGKAPAAGQAASANQGGGQAAQGQAAQGQDKQVGQGDSAPLEDFEEIEEILNRRGIGDK